MIVSRQRGSPMELRLMRDRRADPAHQSQARYGAGCFARLSPFAEASEGQVLAVFPACRQAGRFAAPSNGGQVAYGVSVGAAFGPAAAGRCRAAASGTVLLTRGQGTRRSRRPVAPIDRRAAAHRTRTRSGSHGESTGLGQSSTGWRPWRVVVRCPPTNDTTAPTPKGVPIAGRFSIAPETGQSHGSPKKSRISWRSVTLPLVVLKYCSRRSASVFDRWPSK